MRGDRVPPGSRLLQIATQVLMAAYSLGCLAAGFMGNWGMLACPVVPAIPYVMDRGHIRESNLR